MKISRGGGGVTSKVLWVSFLCIQSPEDAQRPRAVYDIHPDFRGI